MTKHPSLTGTMPVPTPQQAIEAAERKPDFWAGALRPVTTEWSTWQHGRLSLLVSHFNMHWLNRKDRPLDIWDNADFETAASGRQYLLGDCDDYGPEVIRQARAAGILLRGAVRPTLCTVKRPGQTKPEGHMVQAIDTTWGTLILCNLAGLCWLDSRRLRGHAWDRWMEPEGTWKSLKTIKLASLLP